jgi:plasmid stabilization system protein ParE
MNRELVLPRSAEADLQSAFASYEDRVEGLREEFILAVDGSLVTISQFPETGRPYHKTIRRLLGRRFPFGVF